jgi:hypothetical protein
LKEIAFTASSSSFSYIKVPHSGLTSYTPAGVTLISFTLLLLLFMERWRKLLTCVGLSSVQ